MIPRGYQKYLKTKSDLQICPIRKGKKTVALPDLLNIDAKGRSLVQILCRLQQAEYLPKGIYGRAIQLK
jgi:hypothetical protein